MANELKHITKGTSLTQAEFEHIDLHACNNQATGDLIYASSSSQLSRLAVGAVDTVFTSNGTVPSWSATPILNTAVAKGTWTASGTWTIPAVTLGGNIAGNAKNITALNAITFGTGGYGGMTVDDSAFSIRGSTLNAGFGAYWEVTGKSYGGAPGLFRVSTPNAAGTGDIIRLSISGVLATAVATWSAVTHNGMVMSDHLTLHITDTDGTTEADIWYDASEDKLKFKTAAGVETITSG